MGRNLYHQSPSAHPAPRFADELLVTLKSSRPTDMCCSSAAKEASADKVKLDELIVLINKFLYTREMQLPGQHHHPASSQEDSN